jgi:hypothetical protein
MAWANPRGAGAGRQEGGDLPAAPRGPGDQPGRELRLGTWGEERVREQAGFFLLHIKHGRHERARAVLLAAVAGDPGLPPAGQARQSPGPRPLCGGPQQVRWVAP